MEENTIYPSLDFQSSPYDPKWWLDPPSYSTISDDFAYDYSHELQDKFSINSPVSMADQIYGPFPDFDDSFVDENDDYNFASEATLSWYTDDLFDQLACLQKHPTQSVRSYVSEAKSILTALNNAGGSLSDSEFTDFLVEGLDEYLFKRIQSYYYLMHPCFTSLCTLLLEHEVVPPSLPGFHQPLLNPTPSVVPVPSSSSSSTLPVIPATPIKTATNNTSPFNISSDEISCLAVPKSCTLLKSQLLDYFYASLHGRLHSHVLDNSFLLCPSSSFHMKPEPIHFGPGSFFIHDALSDIGKHVYGVLCCTDANQGWQGSYLLQVCVKPKAQYFWLDIIAMRVMLLFNMALRLLVLSIVGGFVISLIFCLRRCSFQCKQKLQYLTFCLRGCIREIII